MDALRARARLLATVRAFFAARDILEVDTPALSAAAVTDPHIESFALDTRRGRRYLHTSPEFPMKRLLAAGSGSIYQICKVFRDGEIGRRHNPEFSMLEWYRVGWDHRRLMEEVTDLMRVLDPAWADLPVEYLSYAEACEHYAGIEAHGADLPALRACAARHGLGEIAGMQNATRDDWLDLLMGEVVIPRLGGDGLCFVYDYPASQAALARVRAGEPPLAERFELFFNGMELANGFHELSDAREQGRRFEHENAARLATGSSRIPVDERLLQALRHGLPDCSGVALGLDRVLMLLMEVDSISDVLAFPESSA